MSKTKRFIAYAGEFENTYETDDWSLLESYFTEDASYEIIGAGEFSGKFEGRDVLFASLREILDRFDRRFDKRVPEILAGPEERDGNVWVDWKVTYLFAGLPDLVVCGEETAEFEGDRIRRLEDRYSPSEAENMTAYFAEHGAKLA